MCNNYSEKKSVKRICELDRSIESVSSKCLTNSDNMRLSPKQRNVKRKSENNRIEHKHRTSNPTNNNKSSKHRAEHNLLSSLNPEPQSHVLCRDDTKSPNLSRISSSLNCKSTINCFNSDTTDAQTTKEDCHPNSFQNISTKSHDKLPLNYNGKSSKWSLSQYLMAAVAAILVYTIHQHELWTHRGFSKFWLNWENVALEAEVVSVVPIILSLFNHFRAFQSIHYRLKLKITRFE